MSPTVQEKIQYWKSSFFDESTRKEVAQLEEKGKDHLTDAFYKDLEFGTGGMRGVMGAGTNRINKYTLGQATQGLSTYLKQFFGKSEPIKVAIAFDCRHNSKELGRLVAEVFSANNIKVYLFEDLRPTPELSFAVRHLNCHAGIVLTASHNPPEYNGYKVYWNDGGQLVPPHDQNVIELVKSTKYEEVKFKANPELIEEIGAEVDAAYIDACVEQTYIKGDKRDLKIVFTSLHGTSVKAIPKAFEKAGFSDFHIVEEQARPNGDFPTVQSPNPEEPSALKMAIKQAEQTGADIIIGTDPDGDRLGVGVLNKNGKIELLNGNQTVALLTWYLIEKLKKSDTLQKNHFVAQTVVTSELPAKIAAGSGVKTYYCLTGFKWIADIIRKKEGAEVFIGGGEESYGYMVGDFVRDKDATTSSLIFAELTLDAKRNGKTVIELLAEIYRDYGFYRERLISVVKKGKSGADEIAKMMENFRISTPEVINGSRVVKTIDIKEGVETDVVLGKRKTIDLPSSNVFQIFTEDGSKITARPSGTEPKIKFYISVNEGLDDTTRYHEVYEKLEKRIDSIIEDMKL